MRVLLVQHQRRFAVNRPLILRQAKALAHCAQKRTPQLPWREVTIHLQDDAGSDHIHQLIMNQSGATDVITQRYESLPGEPEGLVGELFVNVERAETIRKRATWTSERELLLYIAHGMDHLTGANDATPAERAAMRRRELAWLRTIRGM